MTGTETTTCQVCGNEWPNDPSNWFFDGDTPQQPCKDCIQRETQVTRQNALISAGDASREVVRLIAQQGGSLIGSSRVERLYDEIQMELERAGTSLAEEIVRDLGMCAKPSVRVQFYNLILKIACEASRISSERLGQGQKEASAEDIEQLLAKILGHSGSGDNGHGEATE